MGCIEKMEPLDFQELIQKREDWVRSSKENKFNFDSILAGLYNDPSHFIFEILQNAEDAGAKTIIFKLDENQLEISHDAIKKFNADDIAAITGIGISTKKEDINAIGKFGVGFKSVFAITRTPMIHSGEYHFEINDFVVPSPIKADDLPQTTKFILPFNHKSRSREQVFALVQDKLENLGLQSLLFLRSIDEIKWQSPNKSGHYLKSSKVVDNISVIKRVTVISETDNKETLQDYLVIEKIFELANKSLKVEVAFQIGKDDDTDNEITVPVNNTKLTVYFPTEKDTYLKFLIQGPYKTTPNRENIPLDDEQNQLITEQIGELVSESISVLKKIGYLDLNLLNILPIEEEFVENNPIYSTIYEKVKSKLSSGEELLPTYDGKFTTSEDTLLARGQDLVKIFAKADIQYLFGKNNWLDTNITSDQTKKLRDYLVNIIGIKEVDFEGFARNLTAEFFATKDDEWMANFYSHLKGQSSLWINKWSVLRNKPFIRLEDNSHVTPFNEKQDIQVYLPSKTESKYPTVKKTLTENQEVLGFLKNLGLSEPDLFAEIREFILPKYESDKPDIEDREYFEDFYKLLLALTESQNSQQKQELLTTLKELPIVKTINPTTNQNDFVRPNTVYANNPELRLYFEGYESAYFVSEELHSRFGEKKLEDLLRELGVSHQPKRIGFYPDLTSNSELRSELQRQSGNFVSEKDVIDYSLDGLGLFFEQPMTFDRSRILWDFLIQVVESKTYGDVKAFFQGEYKWFYYKNRTYKFTALFTKLLQQEFWLFDRQGNLRQPSEITISDLSDEYSTDFSNLDVLKEVLGFKSDVFEQLPEDEKNILEITKGRSPDEVKKALTLLDEQNSQEDIEIWEPEIEPDKANGDIENLNPETLPPLDLENQIARPTTTDSPKSETSKTTKSARAMRDIGRWGEEYLFNALKARLGNDATVTETDFGCRLSNQQVEIEVYWLNIRGDSGKGYDFSLKQAEKEIEYIEVKTTIEDDEELIIISGTQWEFARQLFNRSEGDKYVIYRVFNAGKSNARIVMIKNPVKLWYEGKLYAHPVNLML